MAGGGVFFETGHRYLRTDMVECVQEFWCVIVLEAPQPGALGRFAFGFEINRGVGQLNRWLPFVEIERGGAPVEGTWTDGGLFAWDWPKYSG